MRRWLRYALTAVGVTVAMLLLGSLVLDGDGMRGLAIAAAIALPLQLGLFAPLVHQYRVRGPGSPAVLAVWGASTLVRLAVVVGAAFWMAGLDGVDLVAALMGLVGLLFVLLLLEPWMLRDGNRSRTRRTTANER